MERLKEIGFEYEEPLDQYRVEFKDGSSVTVSENYARIFFEDRTDIIVDYDFKLIEAFIYGRDKLT